MMLGLPNFVGKSSSVNTSRIQIRPRHESVLQSHNWSTSRLNLHDPFLYEGAQSNIKKILTDRRKEQKSLTWGGFGGFIIFYFFLNEGLCESNNSLKSNNTNILTPRVKEDRQSTPGEIRRSPTYVKSSV